MLLEYLELLLNIKLLVPIIALSLGLIGLSMAFALGNPLWLALVPVGVLLYMIGARLLNDDR